MCICNIILFFFIFLIFQNLKKAKIKFNSFVKEEKFYEYSKLMKRFIRHLKIESLKNVPNIIIGLFSKLSMKEKNKLNKIEKKNPLNLKDNNENENGNKDKKHKEILYGKKKK